MSNKPAINHLQVELHVPDFDAVKAYYGSLGFKKVWERQPDGAKGYLVMQLANTMLCFWAGTEAIYDQAYFEQFPKGTPRGYGVELVIMVDDIIGYYDKVKGIANVVEPLVEQPWGLYDFRAADPFGYYLRFTSQHNILDESNVVE